MAALSSSSKSTGKLVLLLPLVLVLIISITSLLNFDLTTCTRVSNLYWDNHYNLDRNVASTSSSQLQQQQRLAQSPTPFDLAVQLSYDLIDPTTNSIMTQSQSPATPRKEPRTPPLVFDVNDWDTRTEGGLQDLDRILLAELYGTAHSVFEYGLGESTYIANAMEVPRYAGIDSDAVWVTMAREKVSDHFRFYFADIGITKVWGHPTDPALAKNVLHYQLMPLIVEDQPFDIYMSDGRWRIPCMMVSFLHASARGANPADTIVLLHDCFIPEYWDSQKIGSNFPKNLNNRPDYHSADHLVDLVRHSGNRLCVYKRKPTTTDMDLYEFWQSNYNMIA